MGLASCSDSTDSRFDEDIFGMEADRERACNKVGMEIAFSGISPGALDFQNSQCSNTINLRIACYSDTTATHGRL